MVFTVLGIPELDFAPEDIQRLADAGVATLNWNCDDHWRLDYIMEYATHYRHMVTTDREAVKRFAEVGLGNKIILSQWGCNPFDYSPGDGIKDIDICFVGQAYGNRREMLAALESSGLNIAVYGAGWRDGREIDFTQLIGTLRRSKISLNFSRATQGTRRQLKARFFEVPACGTFLLTEPAEGMEQFLKPGRHYDTFDTAEELVQKASQWLVRPERDGWANEASAIVRATNSYSQRLSEVFEIAGLYNRRG